MSCAWSSGVRLVGRTVHMVVVLSTALHCTGDEMAFEQGASSSIIDQCLRAGAQLLHVNVR